jgi:hypothetical protein
MKKNLYITFDYVESDYIKDEMSNFAHSKAFKYLINYNQSHRNCRELLKWCNIEDVEEMEGFIYKVEAVWYSQWESNTFTFNFKKDIEWDSEAMEELVYLESLKHYFTVSDYVINWKIETKIEIEWEEYINTKELNSEITTSLCGWVDESGIGLLLEGNNLNRDDYNLIYDLEKINY